jgi:ribosome-associated translation inhibitor RaiA
MVKKKTTNQLVEDLAISVQKGFIEVKQEMKAGFKAVDERLNKVEERLDKVEERLENIEGLVGGHERRFERLEDDMRVVKTKVGIR